MIDTFSLDYYANIEADIFSKSVSKSYKSMLKKLRKKEKKELKESKEFEALCEEKNLVTGSEDWVLHYEYFGDLVELQVKTRVLRERLSALGEMQIVYLYKCIEVSVKNMLRVAYGADYSWKDDKIIALEKKGIDTTSLEGYLEINTLRLVNNKIKHSEDLYSELNSTFPDFANTESFLDFEDFNLFYEKVLPACSAFLNSLKEKIISGSNPSPATLVNA